jgi:spore germination cell wall hydrolase CwlJ-like protein
MSIPGFGGGPAGRGWRLWLRNKWFHPPGSEGAEKKGRERGLPGELEPVLLGPSEIQLIARLVRAEAEGEPYPGQVAVAAVVLNRLKSPSFPRDVRGVIYQRDQFESVTNGRIDEPADDIHFQAVEDALSGRDPSKGALFFFNPTGTDDRFVHSLAVTTRIGRHAFSPERRHDEDKGHGRSAPGPKGFAGRDGALRRP